MKPLFLLLSLFFSSVAFAQNTCTVKFSSPATAKKTGFAKDVANHAKTSDSVSFHSGLYDGRAWRNYKKQRDYYVSLPHERPVGLSDEAWHQREQEHQLSIADNYHKVTATKAWKKYPLELSAAKTPRETDEAKARLYTSGAWINYALGIFKADAKLYQAPKK